MQEWQEWQGSQGSQEWQECKVEQAGWSVVRSRLGSGLVLLMCSAVLASSAGVVGEVGTSSRCVMMKWLQVCFNQNVGHSVEGQATVLYVTSEYTSKNCSTMGCR